MPLTFRDEKGSALTADEVDANFRQLVEDIAAAAAAIGTPAEISNITVTGSQMTIHLSNGSTFGPYTLPRSPFRPTVTQTVSAASHSPTIDDANGYIRCTNVGGCVVTIPADTETDDIPVDTEISYRQCAAAAVQFEAPTDVILNGLSGFDLATPLEGAVVTIKKVGANEWDLLGLVAESVTA
jgi:hypothetical protein